MATTGTPVATWRQMDRRTHTGPSKGVGPEYFKRLKKIHEIVWNKSIGMIYVFIQFLMRKLSFKDLFKLEVCNLSASSAILYDKYYHYNFSIMFRAKTTVGRGSDHIRVELNQQGGQHFVSLCTNCLSLSFIPDL